MSVNSQIQPYIVHISLSAYQELHGMEIVLPVYTDTISTESMEQLLKYAWMFV